MMQMIMINKWNDYDGELNLKSIVTSNENEEAKQVNSNCGGDFAKMMMKVTMIADCWQ